MQHFCFYINIYLDLDAVLVSKILNISFNCFIMHFLDPHLFMFNKENLFYSLKIRSGILKNSV